MVEMVRLGWWRARAMASARARASGGHSKVGKVDAYVGAV